MARALVHTVIFVALVAAACTKCFSALQDNWTVDFVFDVPPGGIGRCMGIGVDSTDRVYAADAVRKLIHVFSPSGRFERSLPVADEDLEEFAHAFIVGGDDRLYISASSEFVPKQRQTVYAADGTRIGRRPYFILDYGGGAVDVNGDVYVTRPTTAVEVYSADGAHVRTIGAAGSGAGDIVAMGGGTGVAITPDGRVVVALAQRIHFYSKAGEFLSRIENASLPNQLRTAALDNLLYFAEGGIATLDGRYVTSFGGLTSFGAFGVNPRTCIVYFCDTTKKRVMAMRRGFRTLGGPIPGAVPLPHIRRASQRSNGFVDIDCLVTDPDSSVVHTALSAYKNGSGLLRDLIPIAASALVEGTSDRLGPGVTTGAVFRLTWDPNSSGLPSGQLTFELFARDDRPGILDVDYITLPGEPALTISRSPITHEDMRAAWAWLLATGDPELSRAADGEITGPRGAFTQTLNSGAGVLPSRTTPEGREWLFAKLGAREATADEVTRARQASAVAAPNQFSPTPFERMMGNPTSSPGPYPIANGRPMAINEWTFDSWDQWKQLNYDNHEGWWLVRLP